MASQEKVNRTDTQWRERSTMWGRDSHNLVDGVFAQLLAKLDEPKPELLQRRA